MIGAEKPVHYKRVFTITEFTINGSTVILLCFFDDRLVLNSIYIYKLFYATITVLLLGKL